jgi:hypothetical protein
MALSQLRIVASTSSTWRHEFASASGARKNDYLAVDDQGVGQSDVVGTTGQAWVQQELDGGPTPDLIAQEAHWRESTEPGDPGAPAHCTMLKHGHAHRGDEREGDRTKAKCDYVRFSLVRPTLTRPRALPGLSCGHRGVDVAWK